MPASWWLYKTQNSISGHHKHLYKISLWATEGDGPADRLSIPSLKLRRYISTAKNKQDKPSTFYQIFVSFHRISEISKSLLSFDLPKKTKDIQDQWKCDKLLLSLLAISREELNSDRQLYFTARVNLIAAQCPCSYMTVAVVMINLLHPPWRLTCLCHNSAADLMWGFFPHSALCFWLCVYK